MTECECTYTYIHTCIHFQALCQLVRCWTSYFPHQQWEEGCGNTYVCMYSRYGYVARLRQWVSIALQLYTLKHSYLKRLWSADGIERKVGGREGGWGETPCVSNSVKPQCDKGFTHVCVHATSFWGTTVLLIKRKELFIVLRHTFSVFVQFCVSVWVCV